MMNRNAKRYCREVKGWLPCAFKLKRQIIGKLRTSLEAYTAENPNAGYEDIVARFGTPQQIAAGYVDEMETGELLANLRIKWRIMKTIVATVTAMLIVWFGGVALTYIEAANSINGFYPVVYGNIQGVYDDPGIVYFGDGTRLEVSLVQQQSQATQTCTGTKTYRYYDDSVDLQWEAVLTGTFSYDGNNAACISSSCEVIVYDSDWFVISEESTKIGNLAAGCVSMGLNAFGMQVDEKSVNITLICDPDGSLG